MSPLRRGVTSEERAPLVSCASQSRLAAEWDTPGLGGLLRAMLLDRFLVSPDTLAVPVPLKLWVRDSPEPFQC